MGSVIIARAYDFVEFYKNTAASPLGRDPIMDPGGDRLRRKVRLRVGSQGVSMVHDAGRHHLHEGADPGLERRRRISGLRAVEPLNSAVGPH